jgi:hypothetical protein
MFMNWKIRFHLAADCPPNSTMESLEGFLLVVDKMISGTN